MKAILISGGKGERLRPLTNNLPKPMIEVAGKPIIEHIINLFKKNGIKEFIISVCFLPEKIVDYFGDGRKFGVKIEYIYEEEDHPLGTAGNIGSAKELIDSTFIVTYADILRELNIIEMIEFHRKRQAFTTLNTYKRFGADPKSMVLFDNEKRIVSFIERPKPEELHDDFVWANGSFYIFEPGIFELIRENTFVDFGRDVFPKLLQEQKNLFAYQSEGFFVDIGNLEKLAKAREYFKWK